MSKQRECSLSWAIQLCKEKGGRTRMKDGHTWYDKTCFVGSAAFDIEEITATWIYEEPEPPKTAFEAWNANTPKLPNDCMLPSLVIARRKEGWNAAIDEAQRFSLLHKGIIYDDLEKLKEK